MCCSCRGDIDHLQHGPLSDIIAEQATVAPLILAYWTVSQDPEIEAAILRQ